MSYEQRFKVADLQPDVAIGIQLPMVSRNGRLFDQSYSTNVQALSNLHNLLLTNKGERIHQPEFGTDLLSHIFEQNEVDLQDKIGNSIESAIRYRRFFFGFGLCISGNNSTWCFCTEYPTPVPPNNKNIDSPNAR